MPPANEERVEETTISESADAAAEAAVKSLEENGETGEEVSTSSEEDGTATEAPDQETDAAPEEDAEAEDLSKQPESVQQLVDAAFKRVAEKYGRRVEEADRGPKDRQSKIDELVAEVAASVKGKKKSPDSLREVDLNDVGAIESYLESKFDRMIEQRVGPMLRNVEMREAQSEFHSLQTKHPDYYKYGKMMAALIDKHPALPLEYAYYIASHHNQKSEGRDEAARSMRTKKLANLESAAAPIPAKGKPKVKDARDAILQAMDEMGIK